MKKILIVLTALFAVFGLSGCMQIAGGLAYKNTVGEKLDFAYAKDGITPGVTTMNEVRSKIGDPYRDVQNSDGSTTWQYQRIVPKGFFDQVVAETRGKTIYDTTDQTHVTIVFTNKVVVFVTGKEYKDGKEVNFKKGELKNAMIGPNGEIIPMIQIGGVPPAQTTPIETKPQQAPAPAAAPAQSVAPSTAAPLSAVKPTAVKKKSTATAEPKKM